MPALPPAPSYRESAHAFESVCTCTSSRRRSAGERAAPVDSILSDGDSGKRRRRTAHGFQRFWLAVEVDEESATVPGAHALTFHGIAQSLASLDDQNLWLLRVKLWRSTLHTVLCLMLLMEHG